MLSNLVKGIMGCKLTGYGVVAAEKEQLRPTVAPLVSTGYWAYSGYVELLYIVDKFPADGALVRQKAWTKQ